MTASSSGIIVIRIMNHEHIAMQPSGVRREPHTPTSARRSTAASWSLGVLVLVLTIQSYAYYGRWKRKTAAMEIQRVVVPVLVRSFLFVGRGGVVALAVALGE